MRDRTLESTRKLGESQNHGSCNTGEEDDVDDVENGANCDQARECVRLNRNQCCDTACGHGQGVPSPCEMTKSFVEWHVRLVRILSMWQFRVVIPAIPMTVVIVLLLLKINGSRRCKHRGRLLRRVIEWVICLSPLGVDRVTISIYGSCEVCFASGVRTRRCLDPGVGPGGLLRLKRVLVPLLHVRRLLDVHGQVSVIGLRALVGVPAI